MCVKNEILDDDSKYTYWIVSIAMVSLLGQHSGRAYFLHHHYPMSRFRHRRRPFRRDHCHPSIDPAWPIVVQCLSSNRVQHLPEYRPDHPCPLLWIWSSVIVGEWSIIVCSNETIVFACTTCDCVSVCVPGVFQMIV